MVSFYSLSFSVLVRAFCCDDVDDDVEAEREREREREFRERKFSTSFSVFLNFFFTQKELETKNQQTVF